MHILSDKHAVLFLASVFTDLAAAWIAAIVVGPFIIHPSISDFILFLTINLSCATMSSVLAIALAKRGEKLA